MVFNDFEYDGRRLSDYGFVICSFDGGEGFETKTYGADIEFNTVPENGGQRFLLTHTTYESGIEATFYICPDPCVNNGDLCIDSDVNRQIMRWLNRKDMHWFTPIYGDCNIHFNASFVVKAQCHSGALIGYELNMYSDSPYAYGDEQRCSFRVSAEDSYTIYDDSDEIGDIYPDVTITLLDDGDLQITSNRTEEIVTVDDCTSGETITMSHPMITTSDSNHLIHDKFNYNFIKICNTLIDNENTFTFSLPCAVTMSYYPVRKVGV